MTLAMIPTPQISISSTGAAGSLLSACTWVEIDSEDYLVSLSFSYGMKSTSQLVNPSSLTLSVLNTDRTFDPSYTSSALYGTLRIGAPIRVRATWAGVTYHMWYGYINAITVDWSSDPTNSRVQIDAIDIIGVWSRRRSNLVGAGHVWSRAETFMYNLGLPHAASHVEQTGAADYVTPYLQVGSAIATDMLGRLCETAHAGLCSEPDATYGTAVRFVPLDSLHLTNEMTFKPSHTPAPDYPYHRISPRTLRDDTIINSVSLSRAGGTEQTASDATSIATYGLHSFSQSGLLLDSDADVAAMAAYYVARYKTPIYKFDWIDVNFGAVVNPTGYALKEYLFQRIFNLYIHPGYGYTIYQNGVAETYCLLGMTHTVTNPHTWIIRIYLSPASLH